MRSVVAGLPLLCLRAAGGEYVEKIAQLRLHNDTSRAPLLPLPHTIYRAVTPARFPAAGYAFAVHSPSWCDGPCEADIRGLGVLNVYGRELPLPLPPRSAAVLPVPLPQNLRDDSYPEFWADMREIATVLHDCGAHAVLFYHGLTACSTTAMLRRQPGQLFGGQAGACAEGEGCGTVQVFGHCYTSLDGLKGDPLIRAGCRPPANGSRLPAVVQLDSTPASAMVDALERVAFSAMRNPHAPRNVTVDLLVTASACGNYGQFPAMFWSLVPLWTGLAFVWIALSCQIHASFATTIHSVMAVVPVLKLMDVAISAWLWTDCVASGTFSTSAVLAWVAIRSLYEPFFILIFLLIANGWCILRRDMSRATSLTISVVTSSLYVVLALNFLYAGNFWWLVGAMTVVTMVYSAVRVRGFVRELSDRMMAMDSEAFHEMHTQAQHKKGMFLRLERIVQLYLVVQIVDYAFVQHEWQGEHAWKSQVFEQLTEILVVTALGFTFRPKQPGSGEGGRYFLEVGTEPGGGGRRQVPFYEMSPTSTAPDAASGAASPAPGDGAGGGSGASGAVVVVNPNSASSSAAQRFAVGQVTPGGGGSERQSRHRSTRTSVGSAAVSDEEFSTGGGGAGAVGLPLPSVSFGAAVGAGSAI